MKKTNTPKYPKLNDNELVFFQSSDGKIHMEVMYGEENVWLSQKSMALLFDVDLSTINEHLANIYDQKELDESATLGNFPIVQKEGNREVKRNIKMYSLEAVIAVGYRVNSDRGREFRVWATEILKNYIQRGYALDGDRMKYGSRFSARYFDELYEEIKDIRTSERRMYQKITDIYATSFDYSPNAPETKEFFATVQNKLHWAITGKTAAEIISQRVDSKKDKMGLTSWRKSPKGKIMPSDVVIAKNYLESEELKNLDRIGNMYLDYAEIQASKGRVVLMKDWIDKLDAFLKFTEYDILTNAGKISNEVAKELALSEHEKYKPIQDKEYISDFDREIKKLLENNLE
jgi:hypothetical protein